MTHSDYLFGYGGVYVKKLNLNAFYNFGKQLNPLRNIQNDSKLKDNILVLWEARSAAETMRRPESPLLGTARRAVTKLVDSINAILPLDFNEMMKIGDEATVHWYPLSNIKDALTELESVLGNDMPGIAAYLVSKKGIYDTEDLIEHAENHLLPEIRSDLSDQVITDLREAGKCLAYELSTACAFHLWRAVETVIEMYYLRLTGNTFEKDSISRNWGAYIKALIDNKADAKVTTFLDHIREEYRNPHTHPDEIVTIGEAQSLFGVAMTSITQTVSAFQKIPSKEKSAISTVIAKATP